MNKKTTFLLQTIIIILLSLAYSSCDKGDDVEPTLYTFKFQGIFTNLTDKNGNSMKETLMNEIWQLQNRTYLSGGVDALGYFKSDQEACKALEEALLPLTTELNDKYKGKDILPEGIYIKYLFLLKVGVNGITEPIILVTNDGAIFDI